MTHAKRGLFTDTKILSNFSKSLIVIETLSEVLELIYEILSFKTSYSLYTDNDGSDPIHLD